jgi:hypothetical protein
LSSAHTELVASAAGFKPRCRSPEETQYTVRAQNTCIYKFCEDKKSVKAYEMLHIDANANFRRILFIDKYLEHIQCTN